jgi:NADPH-dependent curcumin reductase CurA
MTNRQIHIVELPKGKLGPEHFRLAEGAMPVPGDGELLLKTRLISLDAANRAWMQGATYRAAIEAGQVMAGGAVAEVVESKVPAYAKGDLVFADTGWQEYAAVNARTVQKLPRIEPLSHLLSVYGIAGLTAYFGLLNVGKPKAGETVVVSAAAGSVGVFVGQIAKLKGCRVVGIAGGAKKCDWLKSELGFDEVIDYKAEAVAGGLKRDSAEGH